MREGGKDEKAQEKGMLRRKGKRGGISRSKNVQKKIRKKKETKRKGKVLPTKKK